MANKIIHKHSSVITDGIPKIPTSEQLEYGEIAVNYADGGETISLKNASNEIVEFKSKEYFENIIKDNELVTAAALTDLNDRLNVVTAEVDMIDLGQYAPKNHADTGNIYGLGDESIYGHVKISNGDASIVEYNEAGVAAGMNHTHSDYVTQTELGDLKQEIENTELVVETALTDLDERVNALDGKADLISEELHSVIKDNEYVVATSLNDLNTRVNNIDITIEEKLDEVYKEIEDDEYTISLALNDLNVRLEEKSEEIEVVKTTIGNEATSRETAIQEVYDVIKKNEYTIALSLNDLNTRIKNLTNSSADKNEITSELTTINGRLDEVVKELEDYDLIVSSALTDLDSRLKKMEEILNQNITVLSLGENT